MRTKYPILIHFDTHVNVARISVKVKCHKPYDSSLYDGLAIDSKKFIGKMASVKQPHSLNESITRFENGICWSGAFCHIKRARSLTHLLTHIALKTRESARGKRMAHNNVSFILNSNEYKYVCGVCVFRVNGSSIQG